MSIQIPTEREVLCLSGRKWYYFTTTRRRKKDFSPAWQQPSQWETVTTQPMKSHYTLSFHFPPMDILCMTAPPNFPFSIRVSLPALHQTCMWFATVACCKLHFLLLPNKRVLLVNNLLFYCFKLTLHGGPTEVQRRTLTAPRLVNKQVSLAWSPRNSCFLADPEIWG